MAPFYQLIDVTSGNIIGEYDTDDEALEDLRRTAEIHGWNAIRDCSLMLIDDDTQSVIAMQQGLVRLVTTAA